MKNISSRLLLVLMILSIIFFVGWDVWHAANAVKNSYAQPNEPKNAFMVHIIDAGFFSDQQMCASVNDCVLLRYPKTIFAADNIYIADKHYVPVEETATWESVTAQGVYCPGVIDLQSCFEVITIQPAQTCPAAITYLGFKAPLVPNSCLVEK